MTRSRIFLARLLIFRICGINLNQKNQQMRLLSQMILNSFSKVSTQPAAIIFQLTFGDPIFAHRVGKGRGGGIFNVHSIPIMKHQLGFYQFCSVSFRFCRHIPLIV